MSRTNPVSSAKEIASSDDIKLSDIDVDLEKAKDNGIDNEIVVPIERDISKMMQVEGFYAENITVAFAEPATENENPFVEGSVNGYRFCYRRDMTPVTIPRVVLEYIARARTMRVRTERKVMHDGSEAMVPRVSYSPDYPFTVLHDPSGSKGVAWLKNVLAQNG